MDLGLPDMQMCDRHSVGVGIMMIPIKIAYAPHLSGCPVCGLPLKERMTLSLQTLPGPVVEGPTLFSPETVSEDFSLYPIFNSE